MKATDLFNYRKEDFETIESFSKRVYETAKRYRSSLHFTPQESYHVLTILANKSNLSKIVYIMIWNSVCWKFYSFNWGTNKKQNC